MGLEDRDYARYDGGHDGYSSGTRFRDWEVWKKLIVANVVVFVLQVVFTRPMTVAEFQQQAGFEEGRGTTEQVEPLDEPPFAIQQILPQVSIVQKYLELDSDKVLKGQVWRLITCGFCHDRYGVWHIFVNMVVLWWCGRRLETRYGRREFASFYFASLLVSSLAYVALDEYTGDLIPAIGASGAVWGVAALYALLYPYELVPFRFCPIQVRFLALMYFVFDLHPVLLALGGDSLADGVGHAAHIGGAVFGFLYWHNNWRIMNWIGRFTSKSSDRRRRDRVRPSRVVADNRPAILKMPAIKESTDTLESEMDRILEKIHREGRESLTKRELETLEQASRQLRGQRRRSQK